MKLEKIIPAIGAFSDSDQWVCDRYQLCSKAIHAQYSSQVIRNSLSIKHVWRSERHNKQLYSVIDVIPKDTTSRHEYSSFGMLQLGGWRVHKYEVLASSF
jgi:hypothetical protein